MKTKFVTSLALAVLMCAAPAAAFSSQTDNQSTVASSTPCGKQLMPMGYYVYPEQGQIEVVILGQYPSGSYLLPVYAEVFLNGVKVGGDISSIVPGSNGYHCFISYQHDFSNTTSDYYLKISGGCSCAGAHYSYAYLPANGVATGSFVEYY